MNISISDPKTRKAYSKKVEEPVFMGKRVGEEVDLSVLGLAGYKGIIKGGSDKTGTPMKATLPGIARKKIFIGKGTGYKSKGKGIRVRKSVRGNVVAEDIHQINIRVSVKGDKKLEDIFVKPAEEKKEEGKK